MKKDTWIYIGIFLDERSKKKLKKLYPLPEGWREFYDHMTVVYNDSTFVAEAVKSINEHNIGKKFKLKVVGPGISGKAYAVQVELPLGVVSANKITHKTLETESDGSAVDSNYITNWSKIYKPLYVSGTMEVFGPGEVRYGFGDGGGFEEANVY